jgi:predicted CXXCH cytochrome family protein
MQLSMIGLSRMDGNMATRLMRASHDCHVHDAHASTVNELLDLAANALCFEFGCHIENPTG